MKDISQELQNAFKSNIREIHAEIKLNFSDLISDPSVRVSTNDNVTPDFSYQLINGNTVTPCKYLSMDGTANMSGDFCMMPSDTTQNVYQVGFWSNTLSDVTGVCDVSFNILSLPRTIAEVTITGDNSRLEYPVDYTLSFYNNEVLQHTEAIIGNTLLSNSTILSAQQDNINKITVNITKFSKPLTNVKIVSLLTTLTKTLTESDIKSFQIQEESEISNNATIPTGNISTSKLNLSFVNRFRQYDSNNVSSPLYGNIKQAIKIDVSLGAKTVNGVEYVKVFSGYSKGLNAPENSLDVTTTAFDRLELLQNTMMSPTALQENRTAGYLIDLILDDADISPEFRSVDSRLYEANYTQRIYFIKGDNHLSELKRLSEALSLSVYVEDDIIKVDSIEAISFNYSTQETYTRDDYSDKTNKPLYSSLYNTVIIPYNTYLKGSEISVYTTDPDNKEVIQPQSVKELTFFFDKNATIEHNTILTQSGGVSITNEKYYSDRAILEFTSVNLGVTEIEIDIKAKNYDKQALKYTSSTDLDSQEEFGKSEFIYNDNDIVQNIGTADTIRDNLLGTYNTPFRSATINLQNAGNPALELTDRIQITDRYVTQSYNIVSKTTKYDGGLSSIYKCRKANLEDSFLVDENGNYLVNENDDKLVALTQDIETAFELVDENFNKLITNDGYILVGRI